MSDEPKKLSDAMREDDTETDAALPATGDYTGERCVHCGRVRVYLRRDGRLICEKCERFQDEVSK